MRRIVRYLSLAILLGASLLAGIPGGAAASDDPTLIGGGQGTYGVFTDGHYVVWATSDNSKPVSAGAIYAYTVATGSTVEVTTLKNASVDFDNGVVVWSHPYSTSYDVDDPPESYGVFARDLTTDQETVVTPYRQVGDVHLDDGIVIWRQWEETAEGFVSSIVARNIAAGGDAFVVDTVDPFARLDTESGWVFWSGQDPETGEGLLMMQDLAGGAPVVKPGPSGGWLAGGGKLVSIEDDGIVVTDLASGEEQRVPAGRVSGSDLSISEDGRYLFSAQIGEVFHPSTDTLTAYEVATDSCFVVTEFTRTFDGDSRGMGGASLAGGVLAWEVISRGTANGPGEVHAAPFAGQLPSAPQPDPGSGDPRVVWFPETGHTLGYRFLDAWTANGGLPILGYPLTEGFGQFGTSVQITERQRIEWHPLNHDTPYEFLLGRLGADLLERQGRDWTTFLQADPGAPHYMAVTGHAIAPEFWGYWSSHGLDLGDPGVSFRESLALFGYPLSEPMMETNADGDTVLTQYFERAVFEYHPANAAPYDVLLRRLGAEELAARGW